GAFVPHEEGARAADRDCRGHCGADSVSIGEALTAEMALARSSPTWLLLAYKVPREPSANRVYVWRKLKRLGAVSLQDAVWVLPATAHTREQFRWLAAEIDELGGETTLWESALLSDGQEDRLVRKFTAQVEEAYHDIMVALRKKGRDRSALGRRY